MPRLDGLAATTRIRQFDARTPIISMTGNSHPADVVRYMNSGMNDVLCKPFTRDGLVSILEVRPFHHPSGPPSSLTNPHPIETSHSSESRVGPALDPAQPRPPTDERCALPRGARGGPARLAGRQPAREQRRGRRRICQSAPGLHRARCKRRRKLWPRRYADVATHECCKPRCWPRQAVVGFDRAFRFAIRERFETAAIRVGRMNVASVGAFWTLLDDLPFACVFGTRWAGRVTPLSLRSSLFPRARPILITSSCFSSVSCSSLCCMLYLLSSCCLPCSRRLLSAYVLSFLSHSSRSNQNPN